MDGVIIINKEAGFTSSDVVTVLRGILKMKKIGHTGTLDPIATGVLPMCIGKATRLADLLISNEKIYEARMEFGRETDTGDVTGQVTRTTEYIFNEMQFRAAAASFIGEIDQIPPMYSAIKKDGMPLYSYARAGMPVEREARRVTIYSIEILSLDESGASIRVHCSKGTYIRSLIEDIGRACGYLAVMSALCRIRSGAFQIEDALTLGEAQKAMEEGTLQEHILPIDVFFEDLPRIDTSDSGAVLLKNGNPMKVVCEGKPGDRFRMYNEEGQFKAVYEAARWSSVPLSEGSEEKQRALFLKAYKMF